MYLNFMGANNSEQDCVFNVIQCIANERCQVSNHLRRHGASWAVVVHEDTQHVWDELRQVELKLAAQSHHDLLNQQDDGVLHGVVGCPILLWITTQRPLAQTHSQSLCERDLILSIFFTRISNTQTSCDCNCHFTASLRRKRM